MGELSRRAFLRVGLSAAVAAPVVLRRSYRVFAQSTVEYPERVVRLMRESLVVDMLNQFLYRDDQQQLKERWLTQPGAFTEADFLRFKGTGVNVINVGQAVHDSAQAQQWFAKWNGFLALYPQWLMRVDTAADLARAKQQSKLGMLFGFQSSGQFQTLDDVDRCYAAGLRVSQLSYNFRSLIADGAFEPFDAGVSEYGAKVIARMNRVGIAVDLGHASDKTKLDVLARAAASWASPTSPSWSRAATRSRSMMWSTTTTTSAIWWASSTSASAPTPASRATI
jgi:membrane dipeptidase